MKNFASWHNGLAPGHARDADGTLTIGGVAADAIAERCGTPVLAIDRGVLDEALDAILGAASACGVGVSYAGKALLVGGLVRALRPRAIGIDVCSLGELVTAERAGFPAARMTFHGAGKSDEELDAALDGRTARIVVDGLDELRAIRARLRGRSVDVLLRLNTGIEAHTHEFVRTAGDESKFGIAPHERDEALGLLRDMPTLRLRGLHAHIGSQIYDATPFVASASALAEDLARVRASGFPDADTLVIGGGFGVRMHPDADDESVDVAAVLARVVGAVPSDMRVEIEPGRALIALAGTSLYRVLAIKRFDRRRYAIVDGGMADNPRPALYGAYHHVTPVRRPEGTLQPTTLCGRSCENDRLVEAMLPADLRAGDLLAICATGAYTYSMASNYNRFMRPPVAALGAGGIELWARRETIDDVLRADL